MPNRYQQLLNANLPADPFARQALALLEAELREMALLGLQEWLKLDIVSPDLFKAMASLRFPSWGSWNGLLIDLRKVRNKALRQSNKAKRVQIEQSELHNLLNRLSQNIKNDHTKAWLPDFYKQFKQSQPTKPTLQHILSTPIGLRNRIAHDNPTDPQFWQTLSLALHPVIEWLSTENLLDDHHQLSHSVPWFIKKEQQCFTYNGFNAKGDALNYVGNRGTLLENSEHVHRVLQILKQIMGKTDLQESDFRELLGKLAPEERKGVVMGDYLVGKFIGKGSHGVVHQGIQINTGRQVAIKFLKKDMSDDVKNRFRQEAKFLSQLNHPHIVNVIEYKENEAWSAPKAYSLKDQDWYQNFSNGATGGIKTFIAMEWITGQTLDDYYQQQKQHKAPIDFPQLTQWFIDASTALEHVHQSDIIHRDIKPSNLMINEQGSIKLMDFGIARSYESDDARLTTDLNVRLGSPAYMSPEQITAYQAESQVSPASDIYGLSAIFYELYTQHRLYNHEDENVTVDTIIQLKTNKDKKERPITPVKHNKKIPWEINTILSIGLEHEIADRYQNMESLRRDLVHVQRDEPIEKKPPSIFRRTRLGYRRNRVISNVVSIAIIITLGYFYQLKIERNKTQFERDEAINLVKYMSYELRDILKPIGKLYVMENVQQRINQYFEHIRLNNADDDILREKAIGLIQHADTLLAQSKVKPAKENYQKAHHILMTLVENNPNEATLKSSLSVSFIKLGITYQDQGNEDLAIEAYQTSLHLAQDILFNNPDDDHWQFGVASSSSYLGDLYHQQGNLSDALDAYNITYKIMTKLVEKYPNDAKLQRDLSVIFEDKADIYQEQGETRKALNLYQKAHLLIKKLAQDMPEDMQWLNNQVALLNKIGDMHIALEEIKKALTVYQQALEISQQLTKNDPENMPWLSHLSISLNKVASVYLQQHQFNQALDQYQTSLAIRKNMVKKQPNMIHWKNDLTSSYIFIGNLHKQQNHITLALEAYQNALKNQKKLAIDNPKNMSILYGISSIYSYLGDIYQQKKQFPQALEFYKKAVLTDKKLVKNSPQNTHLRRNLAVSLSKLGDIAIADQSFIKATEWYLKASHIIDRLAIEHPETTQYILDKAEYWYKLSRLTPKKKVDYVNQANNQLQKLKQAGKLLADDEIYFQEMKKTLGIYK